MSNYKDISQAEIDSIELRSDEVQEILSFIPHWIIRWGITTILGIVGLLIAFAYLYKYPDVIPGRITLTSEVAPKEVVIRKGGNIVHLPFGNGNQVQKGQLLAVIESTTDTAAVRKLKAEIAPLQTDDIASVVKNMAPVPIARLGELQTVYTQLRNDIITCQSFQQNKQASRLISATHTQISKKEDLKKELKEQQPSLEADVETARKNLERQQELSVDGTVGEVVVEEAANELRAKERSLQKLNVQITEIEEEIVDLRTRIVNYETTESTDINELITNISRSLGSIEQQLANWELNHLVKAPIGGEISMPHSREVLQYIDTKEPLLTIVPADSSEVIGIIELSGYGLGKLEVGQLVNVKLDAYPYQQKGMLKGNLNGIATLAKNNAFELTVRFDSLMTNFDIPIQFAQDMQGTAEIITEDLGLLTRLFNRFRVAWSESKR